MLGCKGLKKKVALKWGTWLAHLGLNGTSAWPTQATLSLTYDILRVVSICNFKELTFLRTCMRVAVCLIGIYRN